MIKIIDKKEWDGIIHFFKIILKNKQNNYYFSHSI